MSNVTHVPYRRSIDGLRAAAVLLVLGFHVFPDAVKGGFIGVDVFFVISGFLISGILYGNFADPNKPGIRIIAAFYGRRIRRIFPALIVTLVGCYGLGFLLLFPEQFKLLNRNLLASAGFCLNLFAFRETGYFEADSYSKPLLHLWSLGVEEQFYLIWPIVIWICVRARLRVLPVAVFLAGCSFFVCYYRLGLSEAGAFYLPHTRFWELSVGSIAAIAGPAIVAWFDGPTTLAKNILATALSATGIVLVGAGVVLIKSDRFFPNPLALLPTVGAACILCAGETNVVNRWVLGNPLARAVGLVSYPLYLWHWPLLVFARFAWSNGDAVGYRLGAVAIAFALATATYLFIEKPIRRAASARRTVALPAIAMAALSAVAVASLLAGGLPQRFPKEVQELDRYEFRYNEPGRVGEYLLVSDSSPKDFKVDPNEIAPGKPSLVLWGDSHAAQLYPGFDKHFSAKYNIVQRTVMSTGPFLGMDPPEKPHMKALNDFVFETIKRIHPAWVVLAADWFGYDWKQIAITVAALRAVGVDRITVFGPVPHWKGSLPRQLIFYYRTHPGSPLPTRLRGGDEHDTPKIDADLGAFCGSLRVEYVSPYTLLSDKDGVIARVGEGLKGIEAWDNAHLTPAASEYLVGKCFHP